MMKKKITFFLPNLGMGGAENVAHKLGAALEEYECRYLLMEDTLDYPVMNPVDVINIDNSVNRNAFGKLGKFLRMYLQVRRFKQDLGTGICLSFMAQQNFINILTRRRERVVISVRSFESRGLEGNFFRVYKNLIRFLYKRADLIVTVSEGVARDLIENFEVPPEKIQTIYNPIDVPRIRSEAQASVDAYEKVFDSPTLIHVGTLKPAKGHYFLLRIFKQLKSTHPDLKLLLVGDGPLQNQLIQLALNLGLRVHTPQADPSHEDITAFDVYFLGKQSNPHRFVFRSKLFVFPSLWEGFPNVLLEVMACGVPIVSADCYAGPRELLAPGTDVWQQTEAITYTEYGVLLPPFSGDERPVDASPTAVEALWARAVEETMDNPGLRSSMVDAGFRRLEDFEFQSIISRWRLALSQLY
jgi:glycosyltransferase involved in cell wall biosynthesis